MSAFSIPRPNSAISEHADGGNSWQVSYRGGGERRTPSEERRVRHQSASSTEPGPQPTPESHDLSSLKPPGLRISGTSDAEQTRSESAEQILGSNLSKVGA